ncbi:MAG TPA: hypothetical protein VK652_01125 [Steroidobacteraceae bacterium]|nr:hypothetical protein [Steroidobacteraceae bacterium]
MTMADEDDALEGEDEVQAAEGEDGGDDEVSEIEAKAIEAGWKPKAKWRGDTSRWTDAETFLDRTKPAKIRESVDDLTRENRELKKQVAAEKALFEKRLEKMETLNKVQRKKMYGEIEAARRAAVEVGDTAEYDRQNQMEQQLYEAEQEAGKPTAKEEPEKGAKQPHPDVERWVNENPWFTKSKMLNRAAEGIHEQLMEDEPGLTIAENLAKTRAEIIRRFPEKFSKTPAAKNGHSAVEAGQRTAAAPKGKGFTDIPGEERRVMEGHIKEGLYKDKADAAAAYWSQ